MNNIYITKSIEKESKILNILRKKSLHINKWWWKMQWIIDTKRWKIKFSEKVLNCNLTEAKKIIKIKFKEQGKAYTQLATTL